MAFWVFCFRLLNRSNALEMRVDYLCSSDTGRWMNWIEAEPAGIWLIVFKLMVKL